MKGATDDIVIRGDSLEWKKERNKGQLGFS